MVTLESLWQGFRHDCIHKGISAEQADRIELAFKAGVLAGVTANVDRPSIIGDHMKFCLGIYATKQPHITDTFLII